MCLESVENSINSCFVYKYSDPLILVSNKSVQVYPDAIRRPSDFNALSYKISLI